MIHFQLTPAELLKGSANIPTDYAVTQNLKCNERKFARDVRCEVWALSKHDQDNYT